MAVNHGYGKIAGTDALVFAYDTGDTVNSYKGEPTTNLAGNLVRTFSNWNGLTGSTEYYTTSKGRQGVKLITTSSGGVQWYYTDAGYINVTENTAYTISATVHYSGGGTPHPNLFYVRQYNASSQLTEGGKFSSSYEVDLGGGWKRVYRTFTTVAGATRVRLQGYEYTVGRSIYIEDIQLELKDHLTPFTTGTRSATEGLLDLTGNSSIDLSNVSFDSNAAMIFDGTDDRIIFPPGSIPTIGTDDFTLEFVCKNTRTDRYNHFFSVSDQYHFAFKASNTSGILYFYRTSALSTTNTILAYIPSRTDYYHIVGKREGDLVELFINGVSQGTKSGWGSVSIDNNLYNSYIGWGAGTEYTGGDLPITKIYNRALTATEVAQNFGHYKTRFGI